jgi:hypothetical protein
MSKVTEPPRKLGITAAAALSQLVTSDVLLGKAIAKTENLLL